MQVHEIAFAAIIEEVFTIGCAQGKRLRSASNLDPSVVKLAKKLWRPGINQAAPEDGLFRKIL
jgi:hypothetical protein